MKIKSQQPKATVQPKKNTARDAAVANAKKLLKSEEANFTERINNAFRSEARKSKDPTVVSIEVIYDKDGNNLYSKTVRKDGSVSYWMNDATGQGRTNFRDLDGDGNMDKMSHRTKENLTDPDVWAKDKNDDGNFDMIYFHKK